MVNVLDSMHANHNRAQKKSMACRGLKCCLLKFVFWVGLGAFDMVPVSTWRCRIARIVLFSLLCIRQQ